MAHKDLNDRNVPFCSECLEAIKGIKRVADDLLERGYKAPSRPIHSTKREELRRALIRFDNADKSTDEKALAAFKQIEGYVEAQQREAHMNGWHEGRAAANNPDIQYGYTDALSTHNEERKSR